MKSMIVVLFILGLAPLARAQSEGWTETRFHRVHLHNGNFIDGTILSDKPNEVIILIKGGEMSIRRDQIDKVELVKTRSRDDAPIILKTPTDTKAPPGKEMEDRTLAKTDTPEAIRKKVDMVLFKFKQDQSQEKAIPYAEIGALGEEGAVYLASRAPAFDLKSMEAIAAALIQLNHVKVSEKVNQILADYLTHANPSVRGFAATVLAEQGDVARAKYLPPLLQDKDPRVKIIALTMLGPIEDRSYFDPVLNLFNDPDKDVRTRAYRLARGIAAKNDLNDMLKVKFAQNIRHDSAEIRGESADMLGLLNAKDQWKSLADALNDPEPKVRISAAQALSNMAVPESADSIISAMEREGDKNARIYLAGFAVKLRLAKSIDTLINWLSDSDPETKRLAEASLTGVTGQNFGSDPAAWSTWWQANKPK